MILLFTCNPSFSPILSSFVDKTIISGLQTLVPNHNKEWDLLMDSSPLGIEFRQILLTIFSKVVFQMLNTKYNNLDDAIVEGLKNIFGNANCLSMSKPLRNIIGEKIISYIQHFISIIFGKKSFDFLLLKKVVDDYTLCDSYKNQPCKILTLIEAIVARKFNAFLKTNNTTEFRHHLINSEVLPSFFNTNKSIERTQQMHCDSVFIGKPMIQYCDIKSFIGLTIVRCQIALFHENTKTGDKLLNEFFTTLSKYIKDNKLQEEHPVQLLYKGLKNIHIKKGPNRFNEILKEIAGIFFDPKYKELQISFVIDAGKDIEFDIFYNEYIKHNIETLSSNIDLTPFFPSNCAIDEDMTLNVKQLIKQLFPHEFLEQYETHFYI